jgi:hypothetical protein
MGKRIAVPNVQRRKGTLDAVCGTLRLPLCIQSEMAPNPRDERNVSGANSHTVRVMAGNVLARHRADLGDQYPTARHFVVSQTQDAAQAAYLFK